MTTRLERKLNHMIFEAAASLLYEKEGKEAPNEKEGKEAPTEKEGKEAPTEELSSKVLISGAIGQGRNKAVIELKLSRAFKQPKALVKDLGISTATGNSDLKKAASILKQAIDKNEVMAEAFTKISAIETFADKAHSDVVSGFKITVSPEMGKQGRRDGTKYLYATLVAAERAGLLKLDTGVKFVHFSVGDSPVLISR